MLIIISIILSYISKSFHQNRLLLVRPYDVPLHGEFIKRQSYKEFSDVQPNKYLLSSMTSPITSLSSSHLTAYIITFILYQICEKLNCQF